MRQPRALQINVGGGPNAAESQPFSDDGISLPTSVRDAAMKALQSSESVRRRLINAAEDTDADIANNTGKRHRSARMSSRPTPGTNATSVSGCSSSNHQWLPSVLGASEGGLAAAKGADALATTLDTVPSDVPRRPTLVPKRDWSAPRPATAPVFGEDPPGEFQNLYGKKSLAHGTEHSNRGSRKSSLAGGGMDQSTTSHVPGSLHASSHCKGDVQSHALDTLDPMLEGSNVPCAVNPDRRFNMATGGASTAAAAASTAAVAGPSGQPARPAIRRSVSITEKWLSPSDRRKSGGSGASLLHAFVLSQMGNRSLLHE